MAISYRDALLRGAGGSGDGNLSRTSSNSLSRTNSNTLSRAISSEGQRERPKSPSPPRTTARRDCAAATRSATPQVGRAPTAVARQPRREWVDRDSALTIAVVERESNKASKRAACGGVPPPIFDCLVAPFLHFDKPQPNQLYALGGRNEEQEALATVEMFDRWHGRWVPCPPMHHRRAGCSATLLPSGCLLVVGGYNEKGIVEGLLQTCELYDPLKQRWQQTAAPLCRPRWGHGCAALGGKVYVVGGCSLRDGSPAEEAFMETLRSCEVYDPVANKWQLGSQLNTPRAGARLVTLGTLRIAAVGGCDDVFGRAEILATIELYDLESEKWTLLSAQLSTPRTTAAVAALDSSEILIFGGAPSLATCELYDVPELLPQQEGGGQSGGQPPCAPSPRRHKKRKIQAPPICSIAEGRMGCQGILIDLPAAGKTFPLCTERCVVVVGGENGDEDWEGYTRHFSHVLVYNVKQNKWTTTAKEFPPIPTPRTALALCVGPGRVSGHR